MDSIRLPDNSSIFTAEAKAIDISLYHIRDQPEKQFIIYSDSLSVLRSLKNLDHRNPLIQQRGVVNKARFVTQPNLLINPHN